MPLLMLTRLFLKSKHTERMHGARSFMGWKHILDVDTATSDADNKPFPGPKQPVGKISVNLLTEDWLCKKMEKFSLTLVEGYPSRSQWFAERPACKGCQVSEQVEQATSQLGQLRGGCRV